MAENQVDDQTVIRPRSAVPIGNALPAGTLLGEFELMGVLGEGGFGIVYTAWDRSLERKVAVKEYMPSSLAARADASRVELRSERHRETFDLGLRSFVNEAKLLAQFDHPALVKVFQFWEENGTAYMVMPLYEGLTLKQTLHQLPHAPDEAWLRGLLEPLTAALQVLHSANCFHRDIAPDNIVMLDRDHPLLLDFGAARRVIGDQEQNLTVILKPGYAPLEQYAEVPDMRQGAWTDVYALAATVHFAITGKTPPPAVGRMIGDRYVPLAQAVAGQYSAAFLAAVDHGLAVRPEDRIQDMDELREAMALGGGPPRGRANVSDRSPTSGAAVPAAPPLTSSPPAVSSINARKGLIAAATLAALGAAAAVTFWLKSPSQPSAPLGSATATARTEAAEPLPTSAATQTTQRASVAPPMTSSNLPTAVSAAPGFDIRHEFDAVLQGRRADFQIDASSAKATLRVGRDRLGFSVHSAREGYVQVLVLGPDGSLDLMFPNSLSDHNHIGAGETLSLPQANWPVEAAEPLGTERFLVIVSAQPRDYSELSTGKDYIFLKLPTGKDGSDAAARWTRSTPLLLGGLKSCPNTDCEAYGAASFSLEITR